MRDDYEFTAGDKSATMTEVADFIVGKSFVIDNTFSPKTKMGVIDNSNLNEVDALMPDVSSMNATGKIFDTLHNVQP